MIRNNSPSVFENDLIKLWIEDGILWAEYKEIILSTEEAKKIVSDRIMFQNGTIYPAIADIRKIKYINKGANEYLSKEGNTLVHCVAVIVESHVSEILGNFYLKLSKPPLPTKLFRNAEKAKAWVETQMISPVV